MQLVERIGRRMKLRDLNIFLTVANERSISKAATQLAISQPAVSKAIAEMEYMLGAPLLDRGPRGVELTLYGRALIKRSMVIFDELRQSVTDIESLRDPSTGEARIGSTGPMAAALVPAVIDTMTRRRPRLLIGGIEANIFETLLRELRDRNIDLVIGRAPAPITDEDLESETLFDDRLLVVASSGSKWAKRRKITLEELIDEPWTIPPHITAAFRSARLPAPRSSVPFSSISVNTHLVASGRFLGVFPESMLRFNRKKLPLKALPIDLPIEQMSVKIVTRKNSTLSPVAELFMETARTMVRPFASENSLSRVVRA
jgi:DNA-binding transcriptional LysR family regulator